MNKMNFELKNFYNKPSYEIEFKGKKENLFPEQISALLLGYFYQFFSKLYLKIIKNRV